MEANDIQLVLLLVVYFLPAIVASLRGHKNEAPIAIMNAVLGWTVLGWFGCLAWAFSHLKDEDRKVRSW